MSSEPPTHSPTTVAHRFWPALIPALAAVALLWPLRTVVWMDSHDHAAYVVRAIEYTRMWRAGSIYPRWCLDLYGGYGAPLFNFYPPGLFAVTGLWMLAGASATVALKLSTVFFAVVGTVGVYGLVLSECERRDAAFIGAMAFVTMPYRFVCVFARGDLAELSALSLMPLAFWSYRAISRNRDTRLALAGFSAAALQAAVLMTHTLTGQWTTEFIALYSIVVAIVAARAGRWDRVRVLLLAQLFAGALAAVYAVPALLERKLVHIERMTGGYFATTAHLVPWRLFFRFFYFDFATDGVLGEAKRMPLTIGIPLCAAALVAVAGAIVPRARRRLLRVAPWWAAIVLVLLLMTPPMAPLWRHLPFAEFTQFPWRLLSFVTVWGSIAVGLTWYAVVDATRRVRWPLAIVAAIAMVAAVKPFLHVQPIANWKLPASFASVRDSIQSTVVSDEYLPRAAPRAPRSPQGELVSLPPEGASVESAALEHGGYHLVLRAFTETQVVLNQFWFPGWRVRGDKRVTMRPTPDGLIELSLPAAGRYAFVVDFGPTPVRAAATVLTLIALVLAFPLLRRAARLRH